MKPKKLKIIGLNSFVEEQEIDFSLLTEKGFFGIFGPTGSGKSTILDAITIALYGEISRSTKNRLEFINSFRNDMNIYYEFEIGSNIGRSVYSIERHYKRKKDGGISCDRAILKRFSSDDSFEILSEGSNSATESIIGIVGLKCEDFTRSVVLPQGRFSDFLKLTKGDRGKMLERILNLEEFGSKMVFKLKGEIAAKRSELDVINGALSSYNGVTEEIYENMKAELNRLQSVEKELKGERLLIETEFKKFNEVWELQKELEVFVERQRQLLLTENLIKEKIDTLNKARHALNVKPFLDYVEDTKNKILHSEKSIIDITDKYKKASEDLKRTEDEYKLAYDKKDRTLPLLIDRESKLVEAIKLNDEIAKLDSEIKAMRKNYQELKAEAGIIEENLKNILEEKEEALKIIEDIEAKININKITPEYREKVIEALEIEKIYIDGKNKLEDISLRVRELGAHLSKKRVEYEEVSSLKDNVEKELELFLRKQLDLVEGSPGDISLVYEKQGQLQEMNILLADAVKDNSNMLMVLKEIEALEAKKTTILEKLNGTSEELSKLRGDMDFVRLELENAERINMAGIIAEGIKEGEPCPVCGSAHHPHRAQKIDGTDIEGKRELLIGLNSSLEKLMGNENSLNIELAGYESELKLKSQIVDDIKKKLKGLDVTFLDGDKKRFEEELLELKAKIEKHNSELKLIETKIKELTEEKNKFHLQYVEISTEIGKDEGQFELLLRDESRAKESCDSLRRDYETVKKELSVKSFQEEYSRIKKCALEEEADRGRQNVLRQRINELDALRNDIEIRKTDINGRMEAVSVSGRERAKIMQDYEVKRDEYSEKKDPELYINAVRQEIRNINEREASLKIKFEADRNNQARLGEEKSNEEKNLLTLRELHREGEEKLIKVLAENNFASSEDATIAIISREIIIELEKEIREYEDNVKLSRDNILRINKRLNGETIDEDSWEALKKRRLENEEHIESINRQIAGEQKSIEAMERDFEKIKVLSREKKECEHQLALLQDIQELISGNRFVEFAATNQLKYISMEASRRLREITRGRYALELDSNNEFVMRDDFNGGIRRSADTLSGGETFLTSLCLALSLSSNIQLKGNSPLEFFFLDEGFGTLDTELLEVVISSLERLRNDKLCVGIISHVEELKSRVPIKLLVSPATIEGRGTRVTIEYS